MSDNIQLARKDIDNICCIYRSVGEAMYDEPRDRLACRFAKRLDDLTARLAAAEARESTLRGLLREACDMFRCDLQGTNEEDWYARSRAALEGKP